MDGLERRHCRAAARAHLRHQDVDGIGFRLPPAAAPLPGGRPCRPALLGITEAELKRPVELAAYENARTDQLEPPQIDAAGQ